MKINITAEELVSIMLLYLLDKINHSEELRPHDKEFENIFKKIEFLKPELSKFFLNTNINNRIFYKRLRDVFVKNKYNFNYVINIKENNLNESYIEGLEEIDKENNQNNDFYRIKELLKKTINILRKRRFYRGSYTTEKEMDEIIKKVLKEENE